MIHAFYRKTHVAGTTGMARSVDPVQRPARGGQGIDPALDLGVVDQRRGVVRLDPGVDHQRAVQPQCFCSMNAPMPSMSAAGFERVNVTQRKFRSSPGGELAVVDDHDQREASGSDRRARTTGRTPAMPSPSAR